ncbi:hypothetical protein [Teredinibacter turnerae]|uniref:hypothetical protein n=1 Tax=Teredinibacter turnerae TaxID=2426 RepID=UPI000379CCC5|nr:hypothetical protein [Teredinibacter turnerae]
MIKSQVAFWALTGGAVLVGFAVGYGVGKETREATPSNVTTEYSGGVVTIKADVASAFKQGVSNWLSGLN